MRSLSIAAASAAVLALSAVPSFGGGGTKCTSDGGFKITKRVHVTCAVARKVTRAETADKPLPKGWKCTKGNTIIPKGKCTNGNRSFHYGM